MKRLAAALLEQACGFRHGIVPPVEEIDGSFADLDGVWNACIAGDRLAEAAGGGFSRTREGARAAAIAEALERYAAAVCRLPLATAAELDGRRRVGAADFALFSDEQRRQPGFPWPRVDPPGARYAQVFSLADNTEAWVPEELVGLGSRVEPAALPSTSTGLAAHPDRFAALLSAIEELLERDALAVSWLNSLGGRELRLDEERRAEVDARAGQVQAFELTQAWNPHPVVVVCGFLPQRGRPRFSLGAACRGDLPSALEKAWLEWLQGVVFAGYYANAHPELAFADPSEVHDFQAHGVYYTLRPDDWRRLPILRRRGPARALPPPSPLEPPVAAVEKLERALAAAGIRLFYRELTPPDVAAAGLSVVRVLSPELALLHGDERAPFLGGRARDVRWRWPDVTDGEIAFPNPLPHPLG